MQPSFGAQYLLPHPAFGPDDALVVDGPLAGQSYLVDLQREYVELIPGLPYRLLEGESGELYYEFAPQRIALPFDWVRLGAH